jgi:hypothetical protein
MDNQETTLNRAGRADQERVVEFELRRPHREDIKLPKVDMEPVRKTLEDVVLTGIGLSIITARAIARTLQEAQRAGTEAAERPGPITRGVLDLLGHKERTETQQPEQSSIPVLPIADYASLESEQVIARLPGLGRAQLETLRSYEFEHGRRTEVLKAIDGLMEATN